MKDAKGAPFERRDSTIGQPDFAAMLRLLNGNERLQRSVMTRFADDAPGELAGLAAAIATGQSRELRELAHRLKGTLLYMGFPPASAAATELQCMGDTGDLRDAAATLARLEACVATICDAWRRCDDRRPVSGD